jgi:hypothetical protein
MIASRESTPPSSRKTRTVWFTAIRPQELPHGVHPVGSTCCHERVPGIDDESRFRGGYRAAGAHYRHDAGACTRPDPQLADRAPDGRRVVVDVQPLEDQPSDVVGPVAGLLADRHDAQRVDQAVRIVLAEFDGYLGAVGVSRWAQKNFTLAPVVLDDPHTTAVL